MEEYLTVYTGLSLLVVMGSIIYFRAEIHSTELPVDMAQYTEHYYKKIENSAISPYSGINSDEGLDLTSHSASIHYSLS